MTGVSLAGTQLRVNQYNMHDTEWNDVKVSEIYVTIPKYLHIASGATVFSVVENN